MYDINVCMISVDACIDRCSAVVEDAYIEALLCESTDARHGE